MGGLDLIFFDLDDTLYQQGNGVWQAISGRIDQFLVEHLKIERDSASQLRQRYFKRYGTTLTGLMTDHQTEPAEYLAFVHDVPVEALLVPTPEVAAALARLPQRKVVFTNASHAHAQRVLTVLELEDHFEQVIAIEDLDYRNKPDLLAYTAALALAGNPRPDRCMLIDDRLENLRPAQEMGMHVRWVHPEAPSPDAIDFHHTSLTDCLDRLAADYGQARR